jgi:recombination protein RecA
MRLALSKAAIESQIASRFGDVFKLNNKRSAEVISAGIPEIDTLTGGLPRGAITEIFGPASSGRTSLMLATLTHATTHDEVCALVDINDAFDPASSSDAGVDLERLLWIRCGANIEHAFKATDLLLQAGGFGLVMLDISDLAGKDARRIISSWWYRFWRVVENTPTVFLVIAEECCVRSCAALSLQMRRDSEVWRSVKKEVNFLDDAKSVFHKRSINRVYGPSLLAGSNFKIKQHKPINLASSRSTILCFHA